MKCPKCDTNHRYKEGMSCRCGYRFVFDPKREKMSDGKFQAIIRSASSADTYYYTENQLYAAYCRKMVKSPKGPAIAAVAMLVGAMVLVFTPWRMFLGILVPVALVTAATAVYRAMAGPPKRGAFDRLLGRWRKANPDTLAKLVAEPTMHDPPPNWKEPDIYDYGVERVLVVQRDVLVDLLVRNGFHASQRALVIAESGYPRYLLPVAQRLLSERSDLPVMLLHDADPQGLGMASRLQSGGLLPLKGHPVTDLGLAPQDVQRMTRLQTFKPERQQNQLPVDMLAYGLLAGGLVMALDEGLALGALIERSQQKGYDSDGGGGSFG